jgi:hypothetical protein
LKEKQEYSQSVDAILEALIRFKKIEFDYEAISIHADQFSEKNFATNIRNYIDLKLKEKVF